MNSILKKSLSFLMVFCMMFLTIATAATVNATETAEATITFDDVAKRTSFSTSKQVWEENGITVTNEKGSSSSNVADYSKPARFYKSSTLIVAFNGGNITEIVFDCNTSGYATALQSSIKSGGTATASSDKVTLVLTTPAASFTISSLTGGQVRIDGITITYEVAAKNYTVAFNSNGGNFTGDETVTVTEGETVAEPVAPTKEGYVFAGWYIGNEKYDFTQSVTQSFELTAKWINPSINIDDLAVDELLFGETLELTATTSDFEEGNTTITWESSDTSVATIDNNGVVTAQNKIGTAEITATATDGVNTQTSDPVTIKVVPNNDEAITVATAIEIAKAVGKTGTTKEYTIVANVTSEPSNAGTFYINDGTINEEEVKFRAYTAKKADGVEQTVQLGDKVTLTGKINIYGNNPVYYQFNSPTYCTYLNVEFVTGIDDFTITSLRELVPGTVIDEPTLPERDNYTFLGWFNGDVEWDFSNGVTTHMTLEAKWLADDQQVYTVTFDVNGENVYFDYQQIIEVVEGETIGQPTSNPIKELATFLGWYLEEEAFDFNNTPITGNIVLTAKWYDYSDVIESFENNQTKTSINMTYHIEEVSTPISSETWTLVTDVNELNVEDKIIIVAKDENLAMSTTQNGNNRGQTSITKNNNNLEGIGEDVQIITLKAGTVDGTFGFYTGNSGYLYAASSSANYLRTKTTLDDNGSWKITITDEGVATIKAQGSFTRNIMKYNKTSKIFAAYGSGQQDICIYKNIPAQVETSTEYCIDYLQMRFQGILSIEDYETFMFLKEQGHTVTFGVAAARVANLNGQDVITAFLNGDASDIQCTPALVNANGEAAQNEQDGVYYQYAFLLKGIPSEGYTQEIAAAVYVCIDGNYYFMKQKSYSASDVAEIYVNSYADYDSVKSHIEVLNILADAN